MNILHLIRQKKLLKSHEIISALVHQKKNSISYFEAMLSTCGQEPEKILDIIEKSIESRKDISAVAVEALDAKSNKAIEDKIKSESISLLRAFVELEYLDNQQCEQLLLELQNAPVSKKEEKKSTAPEEPEISEAALESLRELAASGNLDPEMLAELENQKKK